MVSAVDSPYLAALCNTHTSRYGDSILTILQHLFTTYEHITPQQLKAHEMDICNMNFHMALPVDTIFDAIDNLLELAEYALMPMSQNQAICLAYVVFAKEPFPTAGLACNCCAAEQQIWASMKIHLCKAQKGLLSLPIANQMYHQSPKANSTQFSAVDGSRPSNVDFQPSTPADTSFYSANSTVTPAKLIETANNVQQNEADLTK